LGIFKLSKTADAKNATLIVTTAMSAAGLQPDKIVAKSSTYAEKTLTAKTDTNGNVVFTIDDATLAGKLNIGTTQPG